MVFIFDAGSGYHRGFYNKDTVRKTLFTVLIPGQQILLDRSLDNLNDWQQYKEFPDYIRDSLNMIK